MDGQNITSFGSYSIVNCPKIHVYFKNIITLNEGAFWDFKGVLMEIGNKCTTLAKNSMYFSQISRIVCHATEPPVLNSSDSYSFSRTLNEGIYVPDDSVADYKTAPGWSKKASKIYPLSSYPYPDELLYLEH